MDAPPPRPTPVGLSLVIPAFNESAVIAAAVREADQALRAAFAEYEILVVDDGSRDGTARIVGKLSDDFPALRLIRHPANLGYGAALRTGFAAARFGRVAFTDADCQFDLRDLRRMVSLADGVQVVVGYRADRKDPWRRRFLSWGYNRLTRALLGTGVRDIDCALKVFRREALADLLPDACGFFVNTEMLTRARRLGYAVAEVPVTHRPRLGGESKVSLREVPRTFRVLLGFWWREVVIGRTLSGPVAAVLHARVAVSPRAALPTPTPADGPRPASRPGLRVGPPAPRRGAV